MIRIAITATAYDAIAATMPVGNVGYETERSERGDVYIWLEERWLDKLTACAAPARATAT
jgi:hypothetical protein